MQRKEACCPQGSMTFDRAGQYRLQLSREFAHLFCFSSCVKGGNVKKVDSLFEGILDSLMSSAFVWCLQNASFWPSNKCSTKLAARVMHQDN